MHNHTHFSTAALIHIVLAVGIAAAYALVPFTAMRKLPLLRITQMSAAGLFLTCAITHLALAFGISHDNVWMLVNDFVQLVSVTTFILSLNRQVSWALRRREERDREGRRHGLG